MGQHPHSEPGAPHYRGFTSQSGHTAISRTPLDEWSARLRDLYLTSHNIHKTQTFISTAGFEPSKRAAADRILRPGGHWDRSQKHSTMLVVWETRQKIKGKLKITWILSCCLHARTAVTVLHKNPTNALFMLTSLYSHCYTLHVSALKGPSDAVCEQGQQNACPNINIWKSKHIYIEAILAL
jgi:hypothetical protein